MDESSKAIESFQVRASEINQVVQVIKDVAEQTNPLALNAAIERGPVGPVAILRG